MPPATNLVQNNVSDRVQAPTAYSVYTCHMSHVKKFLFLCACVAVDGDGKRTTAGPTNVERAPKTVSKRNNDTAGHVGNGVTCGVEWSGVECVGWCSRKQRVSAGSAPRLRKRAAINSGVCEAVT